MSKHLNVVDHWMQEIADHGGVDDKAVIKALVGGRCARSEAVLKWSGRKAPDKGGKFFPGDLAYLNPGVVLGSGASIADIVVQRMARKIARRLVEKYIDRFKIFFDKDRSIDAVVNDLRTRESLILLDIVSGNYSRRERRKLIDELIQLNCLCRKLAFN